MALELIITADGSHSLYNPDLEETYHSIHGAVQESKHVFIHQGLGFLTAQSPKDIHILEIGFGTGLNAFLTAECLSAVENNVHYTALEAHPLEKEIWSALNYATTPDQKKCFELLHDCPWGIWNSIQRNFNLLKLECLLGETNLPQNHFDLIYFDAFAPNKQPAMWSVPILQKVVDAMATGGVFVTYCAKGQLKRDLKSLGLQVETLPGPPGKKEMVRARKTIK